MPSPFSPAYWAIYITAVAIGLLPLAFPYLPPWVHARLQRYIPPTYLRPPVHCYDSITTFDAANATHTCLSVLANGTFGRVFTPTAAELAGDEAQGWRRERGHVVPGLWDGHAHVLQYGEMKRSVQLHGARSVAEVRRRVRAYAAAHPGVGSRDRWIKGIGWDQAHFGGAMPTADDLAADPALRDLYILLDRVDVHCVWVSPAVLALLPAPLPASPPGGQIIATPGPGVFCDNAMALPLAHYPPPSAQQRAEHVLAAQADLHAVGLVGVHDAAAAPGDVALFGELAARGALSLRIYAMLDAANGFWDGAARVHRADGRVRCRSVKLYADGALGSWGAALLADYADRPGHRGTLLQPPAALQNVTRRWAAAGWGVNIHAIGDAANRAAVDALAAALADACPAATGAALPACQRAAQRDARHRIEHAQIVAPADQARMAALGLVASVQPTHATSDMAYAGERLGAARLGAAGYRLRAFAAAGLPVVLGSDFPVEPPDPWAGVYAAATRRAPATGAAPPAGQGWEREALGGVWAAVRGFTAAAAWAAHMEAEAGAVAPGRWADWVVVAEDVMRGEGDSGRAVKVRETWVAGQRVYRKPETAAEREQREADETAAGAVREWRGVREWVRRRVQARIDRRKTEVKEELTEDATAETAQAADAAREL